MKPYEIQEDHMPSFTPTVEQQKALDLFATGETLAIEAGAGTGKTATLKLLAESCPSRRGQYVAFNKAIVEEAKLKFPSSVACNTAHSLAVRFCGQRFASRKNGSQSRMRSSDIAKILDIKGMRITGPDGVDKYLSPSYLAGLAIKAVTRFCQTADDQPSRRHVPFIDGIDSIEDGRRGRSNNDAVAKHLEPAIRKAWADWKAEDGSGRLPFSLTVFMTVCLKTAQLEKMTIGADYILFDECQDANPVLVAIVEAQAHAQIVWVGDSQQQIYSFTGAINALQRIAATNRCFLTRSFRFGPAVADEANTILSWIASAELRLVGTETILSRVEHSDDPDTILTRTNAQAFREVMGALESGKQPFLVGGAAEILKFAEAAEQLQRGEKTYHPELACFDNWAEVQAYVEEDEQGDELRLMVALVDEFGVEPIKQALGGLAREEDADVIISTAHKSKGREWNAVRIASDFPDDRGKLGDDEKRLLYVAVTRAKLILDITQVAVLSPEYDSEEQAEARIALQEAAAARLAARKDEIALPVKDEENGQDAVLTLEAGRREITGEVVSTKMQYGRKNILVKLNGHGVRAYGSCPAEISDVERGARVRFTATFKQSDGDEQFGFFSRPTNAEVLG